PKFEAGVGLRLEAERQVDSVLSQQLQSIRSVPRLNLNNALRKTLLKLTQNGRENILAGRCARAEAQPPVSPFAKFPQPFARRCHLGQNSFRMRQQLFAG